MSAPTPLPLAAFAAALVMNTPAIAATDPTATLDEAIVRASAGAPTIEEVQSAALRRAAIAPDTARRWLRRARAAAALPTLQAEVDVQVDQGWKLAQEAGSADELSQDLGAGRVLRARATWSLDRLIFSPDEVRAARALIDAGVAREQLLVRVTQLYYERLQLRVELDLDPPASPGDALEQELRIREIEALLGAITGLRFRP